MFTQWKLSDAVHEDFTPTPKPVTKTLLDVNVLQEKPNVPLARHLVKLQQEIGLMMKELQDQTIGPPVMSYNQQEKYCLPLHLAGIVSLLWSTSYVYMFFFCIPPSTETQTHKYPAHSHTLRFHSVFQHCIQIQDVWESTGLHWQSVLSQSMFKLGTTSFFLCIPSHLSTLGRVGWGGKVERITRKINKEKPLHSLTYGNMQATSSKLMLRARPSSFTAGLFIGRALLHFQ